MLRATWLVLQNALFMLRPLRCMLHTWCFMLPCFMLHSMLEIHAARRMSHAVQCRMHAWRLLQHDSCLRCIARAE